MTGPILLLIGSFALLGIAVILVMDSHAQRRELRLVNDRMRVIAPSLAASNTTADTRGIAPPEQLERLPAWLRTSMARADFVPSIGGLARLGGSTVLLALLVGWQLGWVGAVGCVLLGIAAGPIALHVLAARRVGRLIDAMPFYFDAIRQMMMAGSSLQQALQRATENADDSIRRYLDPVCRRMQNGASPGESLTWQAERIGLAELHMFSVAVQASLQYGGRLSVVLSNLSATLRDRIRISRELHSATAEMRVSGYIVGALPVISGVVMSMVTPGYATFFLHDPTGHKLLAVAVGLQLIGVLVMRKLMQLDY